MAAVLVEVVVAEEALVVSVALAAVLVVAVEPAVAGNNFKRLITIGL